MAKRTVLAEISTKDRYDTTLHLTLAAIANQTVVPNKLVIYDDGECRDLRTMPQYNSLLALLMLKGCQWYFSPGTHKGQHYNHQRAQTEFDDELIWRLDDDVVPEPDVLEKLLKRMEDPRFGAVGGLILNPLEIPFCYSLASGKIMDVFWAMNVQWFKPQGEPKFIAVEHLHCSFLYKRGLAEYNLRLSQAAHREETLFSYEIHRKGYMVGVDQSAVTWHLRSPTGGIRSYSNADYWNKDEKIFYETMHGWKVLFRAARYFVLNAGLGDHYIFKSEVLPWIKRKYRGDIIILSVCYPDVFRDDKEVQIISIADAQFALGMEKANQLSVYGWMWDKQWYAKPIAQAWRRMVGVEDTDSTLLQKA